MYCPYSTCVLRPTALSDGEERRGRATSARVAPRLQLVPSPPLFCRTPPSHLAVFTNHPTWRFPPHVAQATGPLHKLQFPARAETALIQTGARGSQETLRDAGKALRQDFDEAWYASLLLKEGLQHTQRRGTSRSVNKLLRQEPDGYPAVG